MTTDTEEAMSQPRPIELARLIAQMRATAKLIECCTADAKVIADNLTSSRDARTLYNMLGPLDVAAKSLEGAIDRLSGGEPHVYRIGWQPFAKVMP